MRIGHNVGKKMSIGIKASIIYVISSLLSKGLAIITVPIFTRLMSTEQIGIVNLFNSWQVIIGVIASLSLTSGGYMLALQEYRDRRNEYMSSVLTLTSLMAIFFSILYFLFPSFWNSLLGLSTPLVLLILVGLLVSPAMEFWLARQRYEYKYKAAGLITMSSALLAAISSVFAVVIASQREVKCLAEVRLFSNAVVVLGVATFLYFFIMIKGKVFFEKNFWLFSLKLSIPLMGNSIAMQILNVSDRTMISKMVGNSAVGIYSVLYTVSSLSSIVWGAINSSFVPYLFQNIDKKEGRKAVRKVSTKLMLVYSLVAISMTLVAPEVVKILATEEYYSAIYIMPPIAAGVFLTSISNLYSNILVYYKKTKYIMISSVVAAILNVVLNYICIQGWGYMAAAYTTLLSYIILAGIQCLISRKICKACSGGVGISVYDDKQLLLLSGVTVIACLGSLALYHYSIIRYSVIMCLIFFLVIFGKGALKYFGITK